MRNEDDYLIDSPSARYVAGSFVAAPERRVYLPDEPTRLGRWLLAGVLLAVAATSVWHAPVAVGITAVVAAIFGLAWLAGGGR